MRQWLMWFGLALLLAVPVGAQDMPDPFAPYEGIPATRTEDGGFVLGDPDAPITFVEFGDFMCPHCQNYHPVTEQFIADYVRTGLARFEYRLYPVVHPTYSSYTAQLAECADDQLMGGFWPASNVLYRLATADQIGPSTAENLAEELGISAEKLDACASDARQFEVDLDLGESLGVSGTPATLFRTADGELGWAFIDGEIINRGGLPLEIIELIVNADDPESLLLVPRSMLAALAEPVTEESACAAPCWRGIIPGETEFVDVADLIRADSQFFEISEEATETERSVSWLSYGSTINQPNFVISDAEGLVDVISIIEYAPFGLGEVIDAQGDPDFALGFPDGEAGTVFYLFFEAQSTLVLSFIPAGEPFDADSSVIGAQFITPARMSELVAETSPVAWTGFEGFDSYLP